ncbi:MAG: methyltransferase [Planctomycetota bacterium]
MTPDQLMQMIQGIQASAVLKAGLELRVFDALATGPRGAEAVAAEVGADPRGARILLDALAALGVLAREGAEYALSPVAAEHLVSGRPHDLGGSGRLFTSDHMFRMLATLPAAVRAGGAVIEDHAEVPDHPFWTDFATWTSGMAGAGGAALAAALAPWASGRPALEVLDVACGTGLYGYSVAAAQPQARVTSLDWPSVLQVTRTYAERLGVSDRVRYLEGSCFTAELGGPYDLAILSHIFHHFDEASCLGLLARVAAALRPGGRVAIHEFVTTDAPPRTDPAPHLFSTIMLSWTRRGEAYSLARYQDWLRRTGFGAPEVHPSAGMPTRILVAEKL